MFRKLALAFVTVASLSAPAIAFGGGHFGGGHFGGGHFGGGHFGGSHFAGGNFGGGHFRHGGFRGGIDTVDGFDTVDNSCYQTILTDFGPRRINVCE